MSNQKKQVEKKDGVNPMVAAVTVGVVGAGIAVAGAIALKDKKRRDRVKKVLVNVKDHALDYMEAMQNHTEEKTDQAKKKLGNGIEEVKRVTSSAKRQIHHASAP